jgi:hypothetical protein
MLLNQALRRLQLLIGQHSLARFAHLTRSLLHLCLSATRMVSDAVALSTSAKNAMQHERKSICFLQMAVIIRWDGSNHLTSSVISAPPRRMSYIDGRFLLSDAVVDMWKCDARACDTHTVRTHIRDHPVSLFRSSGLSLWLLWGSPPVQKWTRVRACAPIFSVILCFVVGTLEGRGHA